MATATKVKPEAAKPTRQTLDARLNDLRAVVARSQTELANTATDSTLDFESWISRRRQIGEQRLGALREIVSVLEALEPIYKSDFVDAQKARVEAERQAEETVRRLSQDHFNRLGPERSQAGAMREIVRKLVNQDSETVEARQRAAHAGSVEAMIGQRLNRFSQEIADARRELLDAYCRGA